MGEQNKDIKEKDPEHRLFEDEQAERDAHEAQETGEKLCKRRMIEAYMDERRLEHLLADYDSIDDKELRL